MHNNNSSAYSLKINSTESRSLSEIPQILLKLNSKYISSQRTALPEKAFPHLRQITTFTNNIFGV
jgi:hypothetical protein